jgi:SAM-dependent methyltransferase
MTNNKTEMPDYFLPDVVPTLNGRGYMFEALDPISKAFIDFAANQEAQALDIGCAYGVATLGALNEGARVVACDMEERHLEILASRCPEQFQGNLTTIVGKLPDVPFEPQIFGAILASRILHFLKGEEIEQAVKAMSEWLEPGGKLFLVCDTPYMPPWNAQVELYKEKKKNGDPWPGLVSDFSRYFDRKIDGERSVETYPDFLNALDPDILTRVCEQAGLVVERAEFFGLQREGAEPNGYEHAACIAAKPPM